MRIEDFIIMVFCLVDDTMQKIIGNTPLRKRGFQPSLNDSEVITMELLGEYLQIDTDKGIWKYFTQHWHHFFPGLNSRSNFSKHTANLWQIKQMIQAHLVKQFDNHPVHIHIIDGFPIPTANIKRSRKSIFFKNNIGAYGYCASKDEHYFGLKGVVLINQFGLIINFTATAANVDERRSMRELIDNQIQGLLLGDKGLIVNEDVNQELKTMHINLQTPLRKNMKDPRSPEFVNQLKNKRRLVETVIGQLSSRFNIERNWGRDVWHLTNRLWRKILSHTIAFCLNSTLGSDPLKFDNLLLT